MPSKKGRRYEHGLATALDGATTDDAWVTTAGYSGNADVDSCDVVVTVSPELRVRSEPTQYNLELKKVNAETGYRTPVVRGSSSEMTGVDELLELRRGTPSWAVPILVVSFDHRAPVVTEVSTLLRALDTSTDVTGACEADTTEKGTVTMVKPDIDDHPSARRVDEGRYVAKQLALPLHGDGDA